MKLQQDEVLALFIDFQEKLLPVMARKEELLANSVKLAKGLNILKVPHIVSQQYTKGIGHTVEEMREALGDDAYFDKITFSCLETEEIEKAIDRFDKDIVIVCGIEAHICVQQTVSDLLEDGYEVVVVADCVDSRKISDCQVALERMRDEGAIITTCEALLYELTNRAGSDCFKEISRLTK
ncbi:MAG: isochorismatase family protein [Lachnospiraceae bacterium]|nr:isochorismatase family protein [Lachnospiraceae bacterium]